MYIGVDATDHRIHAVTQPILWQSNRSRWFHQLQVEASNQVKILWLEAEEQLSATYNCSGN